MFRRSQSTDFTCAVSQAVRILNICKTFHKIQVPLNFLFKFTGINLVLVNIKPVEFHLIRLCSFCNIYMSNDVKFFETPRILFHLFVGSMVEWLEHRDCDRHGPGSKPTRAILLRPWERH